MVSYDSLLHIYLHFACYECIVCVFSIKFCLVFCFINNQPLQQFNELIIEKCLVFNALHLFLTPVDSHGQKHRQNSNTESEKRTETNKKKIDRQMHIQLQNSIIYK